MSGGNEHVPRLQHVTAQDQRVRFVVDRTIHIGQPQVGNGPRPFEHRAEPARSELDITTDERALNDKPDVIKLDGTILTFANLAA